MISKAPGKVAHKDSPDSQYELLTPGEHRSRHCVLSGQYEHQIRMIVLNRLGDKMYQEFHAWQGNLTGKVVVSKMYELIEEVMKEDGGKCH